jgi:YkoY family integral membrane protein
MLEQLAGYQGAILSFNTLGILIVLVALEASLSADNAVAIATLVQDLDNPDHQRHALNWGLVFAFVLRIGLLLTATWVMQFWQVALAAALYLLWMAINYFLKKFADSEEEISQSNESWQASNSLWSIIPLIALTDLAFSLDSVTAAVALSNQTWLILTGVLIGVIALRFLAELFLHWIEKFPYLQDAAYLVILTVGLRMLCKVISPDVEIPDWLALTLMTGLFTWGFSKQAVLEID